MQNVSKFTKEDFDILIDLSNGDHVPLNFIFKESKARMKVGLRDSRAALQCDFMIDLGDNPTIDKYLQNLDVYLSNPQIK